MWDGSVLRALEFITRGLATRRTHLALLHQIRSDVEACADAARVLRDQRPLAPATELPSDGWKHAGRQLHSYGVLTHGEYDALRALFDRVADINTSIQRAAKAVGELETNRSAGIDLVKPFEKARRLIELHEGRNLHIDAQAAIATAITRRLRKFWTPLSARAQRET